MVKELFWHGLHGFSLLFIQLSGARRPRAWRSPRVWLPKWKAQPSGLAPKVQSRATLLWGLTPVCRGSIKD